MRLEGSLDAFSLPDIFALLSMTTKTGGLHLRRAHVTGVVWFHDGAVTGGASDVTTQSLGRRVAGSGRVGDHELAAAVDAVAAGDGLGLARALLDAGAVDDDAMRQLVSEHVTDTVFDLLRWPDGEFGFVMDEANPDDVGFTRPVGEIVEEVQRRLESWTATAERVPSSDAVVTMALAPDDDPRLSREEWALLALVDGRRSVGDLVALCGRGEYAVVGTLADLVSRGLVRMDGAEDVMALVRRQALLERLQSAHAPADPEQTPGSTDEEFNADVVMAEVTPMNRVTAAVRDESDDAAPEPDDRPSVSTPSASDVPVASDIEPAPDLEPEPVAMSAVAGGGAAGAVPLSSSLIERDPSVNKSLLLRLIAGVRGL